jgi:hypothetical protein
MYLFSRQAHLAPGNTRAAMTWATAITEKANQITGLEVSLFSLTFSPGVGTLAWSTFVPDLPTLETASDKLLVDDGYISLLDEGAKYGDGGADDTLAQVIHGAPDPNRSIQYASTVQTVCANGNVMKGIELGVEIAQRAEQAMGLPVLCVTAATGPYGSVGWITGYADVNELEHAQEALAADAKFGEFIDKSVKGVYTDSPADSQTLIYRRIA